MAAYAFRMPFTITPGFWYAWQMLPGYAGNGCVPYLSPIRVNGVIPAKTGKGLLRLRFWNVGYAEGVQNFEQDLRVLYRGEDYMLAHLPAYADRCAVVSGMSFSWLNAFFPHLKGTESAGAVGADADTTVHRYLDSMFSV